MPKSADDTDASDTALGDWYVNRITIDRQPLLLIVSSESRLAIVTPARDVKTLPRRIGSIVANRLERLGIGKDLISAELRAMQDARVGPTRDRSITGQMVDFAKAIPYYMPIGTARDENMLRFIEDKLSRTPCLSSRSFAETVWPDRETARLLADRWPGDKTVH